MHILLAGFDLSELWPHLLGTATLLADLAAAAHVVMYKRDSRSAIAWMGVIWLVPVLGAVLYVTFGINRVRRKAIRFRGDAPPSVRLSRKAASAADSLAAKLQADTAHLAGLDKLVHRLTDRPLLAGNQLIPLAGGDEAYPAMLAAIDSAQQSIALSTYIFDSDEVGQQFVAALAKAVERGVQVRVIVDDIGARYSLHNIEGLLRRAKVPMASFMPTLVPWRFAYANLRNHRKLLIVDGRVGFTGGMNIRIGHWLSKNPRHPIRDMHFRVEGPVVAQMQEVFAIDWSFCRQEGLDGDTWFPRLAPAGEIAARGITSGPDGDHDKRQLALLGALACARSSVAIVTPYFLPDYALMTALTVAAMRGVTVDVILPENNNLRFVKWASTAMLWQILEHGCRVWLSPGPFDHTKLMVVDGLWSLIGSGNWDPRSLRLNFEFDVECYDAQFAGQLNQTVAARLEKAHQVTLAEVDGRGIPIRLRDGLARLLTPYL